jgi:DNA helicase IV
MKFRTISLAPGRAAAGMILAGAVIDREGHSLLAAGTVLDASIIDRLSRRGIESIAVNVPDTRSPETIAEALRLAEARVALIFRGDGNAARAQLHSAVLHYRQEANK